MERDLPEGWELVTIEQIGEIVTGGTPPKASPDYYGHEIPFYKPTDLNAGYHTSSASENLSALGATKARLLPEKSILVTCIGATIGKTGFIRKRGTSNQQINSIIPFTFISPEYIYFSCISVDFQIQINKNSSSTTLPILNKSRFSKLTIPIPPLAEQKRIVAKLDAAFVHLEKIKASLARIPELLKRFREAVLTQAVTGSVETIPLGNLHVDIQTGPFGSSLHKEDYIRGGVPVINPSHVKNGEILPDIKVTIGKNKLNELKTFLLNDEDVILGRRGEMGRAAVYKADSGEMLCGTGSIILRKSTGISSKFLCYFLRSPFCVRFLDTNSVGSTMINLNQNIIKSLPFPKIGIEEQEQIVSKIEGLFFFADSLEKQYYILQQKIDALPQTILTKAFRGELVPQDPDDEPAAVLLEKIRKEMGKLGKKVRNQVMLDFVER